MSTYAIGDIHGCLDSLQRLLEHVNFDPAADRLWLTGDLVNRGPNALATLRWVYKNAGFIDVVLGNHDLNMLAVAAVERVYGSGAARVAKGVANIRMRPSDTFGEILAAPDRDELLGWLQKQPLVLTRDRDVMVHAALLPQWSVEDALRLSGEVQRALKAHLPALPDDAERLGLNQGDWDKKNERFFDSLYGNKPGRWSGDLEGATRLRVIINAMTRLRVCEADGTMAFDYSATLADMPEQRRPWFSLPDPAWAGHTVIFGHWSAIGVYQQADPRAPSRMQVIGLDSGCVWGNTLSALRLEDRAIFRVTSELAERSA
ncbi:diadenosine tetraphosphatase [Bradymonas sediminis]|uniref:bis(5'-nucleosyl)-tetraphosphatase (symmetrical) n=1 Tax=Bradymonas sediminis TaxID=1548548 RepID=A0A2Z4FQ53_9DELT|nr:diadenosine tetraphosphatase [Bradymonas sediminis]AWV91201.1 diadenosine tetraphosphatase [Bradymonas sediminis]TDP73766.1 bis(5'nucleosyl)-tetraphosphatase ApaH [Bradymonas sediminis]